VGVNKATAALFYRKVREAAFVGEVEADESYFGGAREGRRGQAGPRGSGKGGGAERAAATRGVRHPQAGGEGVHGGCGGLESL